MPKLFLNEAEILRCLQEQGRMGMPGIMEPMERAMSLPTTPDSATCQLF